MRLAMPPSLAAPLPAIRPCHCGLDVNADGKITQADAVWNTLKIWRDADGDGMTDSGELQTLAELGITEFSLADQAVQRNRDGNYIYSQATALVNGQAQATQAIFFGTARNVAVFEPPPGFATGPACRTTWTRASRNRSGPKSSRSYRDSWKKSLNETIACEHDCCEQHDCCELTKTLQMEFLLRKPSSQPMTYHKQKCGTKDK
jgi:hypothetical protein